MLSALPYTRALFTIVHRGDSWRTIYMIRLLAWAKLAVLRLCPYDRQILRRAAVILKAARDHNAVALVDACGQRVEIHQ